MNTRLFENKNLLENHFYIHRYRYIGLMVLFLLGVLIGSIYFSSQNGTDKAEIKEYLAENIGYMKEEKVELYPIFIERAAANLKMGFLIWLLGSSVIGVPLLIFFLGYRGFLFGFTMSSLLGVAGKIVGNIYAVILLVPHNIILIPTFMAMIISGIKLTENVIKNKKSIKLELLRHTIHCSVLLVLLVLAAIVESYFNVLLFCKYIQSV